MESQMFCPPWREMSLTPMLKADCCLWSDTGSLERGFWSPQIHGGRNFANSSSCSCCCMKSVKLLMLIGTDALFQG